MVAIFRYAPWGVVVCGTVGSLALSALPFADNVYAWSAPGAAAFIVACFLIPAAAYGLAIRRGHWAWPTSVSAVLAFLAAAANARYGTALGGHIAAVCAYLGVALTILLAARPEHIDPPH